MFGLGNLIKPEFAVNMLRKDLEKQLSRSIDAFSVLYNAGTNSLSFFIENKEFKSIDQTIGKIIAEKTASSLAKGEILDMVKIDCAKEIICGVYYRSNEGKKEFKTFKF